MNAIDTAIINELTPILNITYAKRLEKGCEQKFYIETSDGKYLLRILKSEWFWSREDESMYKYVESAGIPIMQFISTGDFAEGKLYYQLFSWFEGEDLSEALPRMSASEQYEIGVKCGKLMKKLHTLPPMHSEKDWKTHFGRKLQEAIEDCPHSEATDTLIEYLLKHQYLFADRPLSFTHGDWNVENLMLTSYGEIGIIDLSGENACSDPWFEFWLIPNNLNPSVDFYKGEIQGYFNGEPPIEFYELLKYYLTYCAIKYPNETIDKYNPDIILLLKHEP